MEQDPAGGSDVGRDLERDLGDEPPALIRDSAPDYLAPIDASAPVSGHSPAPEIDVVAGRRAGAGLGARPRPALPGVPTGRDAGPGARLDRPRDARRTGRPEPRPAAPRRRAGRAAGRLHASTPGRTTSSSTAITCCPGASNRPRSRTPRCATSRPGRPAAPWTDEVSGERRLISSDTGNGWDAARILLPEVVAHLVAELGPVGRILVGLPERHLHDGRLAATRRRRLRGAVRRLHRRAVGRRRRADRPPRLRARRRPAGRVRRGSEPGA